MDMVLSVTRWLILWMRPFYFITTTAMGQQQSITSTVRRRRLYKKALSSIHSEFDFYQISKILLSQQPMNPGRRLVWLCFTLDVSKKLRTNFLPQHTSLRHSESCPDLKISSWGGKSM